MMLVHKFQHSTVSYKMHVYKRIFLTITVITCIRLYIQWYAVYEYISIPSYPRTPFEQLFEHYTPHCSVRSVLIRGDGFGSDEDPSVVRPWSVSRESFKPLPQHCSNTESILSSTRFGQRVWNSTQNLTDLEMENLPSVFVPSGCSIHFFSPEEACNMLDKYSTIILSGDSFTRHMIQALWMILRGNLACSLDLNICLKCACDGTFSEHIRCRYGPPTTQLISRSMCPNTTFQMFHVRLSDNNPTLFEDDPRPKLFFLQGGIHFSSDVNQTWNQFLEPWLFRISNSSRIIYTGLHANSVRNDGIYPHQSRPKVRQFSVGMEKKLEPFQNVVFLDFFNLTRNARSTDGQHYVSDVNLYKAMVFLNLLKNMV